MTTYSSLKYNHPFSSNATGTGSLTLISSQTASASANISFTSGIDSTYDEYIFKFINMHPSNDGTSFQFQASTNGGSSYGINKVSTFFQALHDEADTSTSLAYSTTFDRGANTTDYITINSDIGNENDQCFNGVLHLFNPSNTTFVKHYIITSAGYTLSDQSSNDFVGGYFNTTSAINAIKFEMRVGNIDDGTILMYGVL